MKAAVKKHIRTGSRYAIFVMSVLALGLQFTQASANKSFECFMKTPGAAVYSTIAK